MDSLNLVLASASPRRRQLLASLGLECEVAPTHIDERPHPGEDPADYARRLAAEKAAAGAARHPSERLLLAADTVVALGKEILGKPADEHDAARMLRRLSGRTHQVHTAVAARQGDTTAMRLATTEVTFRSLRDAEIEAYVSSGDPFDKAGAYGIQGAAAIFVTRLSGSYSGVVGLPLCETAELLREFGVEVLGLATGGDA